MLGGRVIGQSDVQVGILAGVETRFLAAGIDTGGAFALVEHPLEPRALGGPLHRHSREDEYIFVMEGRVGADLGGDVVYARPGDLICKPRGQWHTSWNAGDQPARILGLIAPAGFEEFLIRVAALADRGELDSNKMVALAAEYGTEIDMESIPRLVAAHGVTFGSYRP